MKAFIFDLNGTLVDSVYPHTCAKKGPQCRVVDPTIDFLIDGFPGEPKRLGLERRLAGHSLSPKLSISPICQDYSPASVTRISLFSSSAAHPPNSRFAMPLSALLG
jgi:hypothetical protein